MKIYVEPHIIKIEKQPVNEKEININKCEFEFDEEITNDFVKEAYFTFNDTTYMQLIQDNECDIPQEVLAEKGQVELGVVAYLLENTRTLEEPKILKRYNPSPVYFNTWLGSLKDEYENSEEVTPTDKEQILQALTDVTNAMENLDIDANKVDDTTTITITKKDGTTKEVEILDGEQGPEGEQGPQGIQGPVGPQGPKGDTGEVSRVELDETSRQVYNALPKVKGSGTNIMLENTADTTPLDIKLKGNTYQETTTGKNLLNIPDGTYYDTSNTYSITVKDSVITPNFSTISTVITINVPITLTLPAGTYTYNNYSDKSYPYSNFRYDTTNVFTVVYNDKGKKTFTFNEAVTVDNIQFYFGSTSQTYSVLTPQIEVGSTSTDFERYTYGASPNPDYPQEVQVVTGDNTIKVCNENILNRTTCTENNILTWATSANYSSDKSLTSDYIKTNVNENYSSNYWASAFFYDKNKIYLGALQSDGTTIAKSSGGTKKNFTIPNVSNIYYVRLVYRYGSENDNVDMTTADIMVNKGNTLLTYTPHQEQEYEINLGKNLIPFISQDFTLNSVRYYVENGTLYFNGTSSSETLTNNTQFKNNFSFTLQAGTYYFNRGTNLAGIPIATRLLKYSDDSIIKENAGTFTLTEETKVYIGFYVYNKTFTNLKADIQLEVGTQATSYSPYFTPIELCKIGTYQDYLYKSGENWYKHTEIGKVVLNGSENWQKLSGVSVNTCYVDSLITATRTNSTAYYYSNYYGGISNDQRYIDNTFFINSNNRLIISNNAITSANDFKTWLSTHNTTVYYVLETPTEEQITNEELIDDLNSLYYATSYQDQTNINSSGNLATLMDAVAVRDLSNIFDSE